MFRPCVAACTTASRRQAPPCRRAGPREFAIMRGRTTGRKPCAVTADKERPTPRHGRPTTATRRGACRRRRLTAAAGAPKPGRSKGSPTATTGISSRGRPIAKLGGGPLRTRRTVQRAMARCPSLPPWTRRSAELRQGQQRLKWRSLARRTDPSPPCRRNCRPSDADNTNTHDQKSAPGAPGVSPEAPSSTRSAGTRRRRTWT